MSHMFRILSAKTWNPLGSLKDKEERDIFSYMMQVR